jgi:hypothetical protein
MAYGKSYGQAVVGLSKADRDRWHQVEALDAWIRNAGDDYAEGSNLLKGDTRLITVGSTTVEINYRGPNKVSVPLTPTELDSWAFTGQSGTPTTYPAKAIAPKGFKYQNGNEFLELKENGVLPDIFNPTQWSVLSSAQSRDTRTIALTSEPSAPIPPETSVNLRFGNGPFYIPLEDTSGTWLFSCTDGSLVWNESDEPLIANLDGVAVPGAIANGSKIAAIGNSSQQYRLNGVTADGPLIYRTAALVAIQRPEGQTVFEVTVIGGGSSTSSPTALVQATAPDPAMSQFWFNTNSGGMVLNISDGTAWFAVG